MGTSADYSAPPNWSNVKGDVTRLGGRGLAPAAARDLLRDYISTGGGSRGMSSGGGQLGTGATARQAARTLGGFVASVARDGLDATLRANGLEELIGKSVTETLLGIVALCGGTDGDIDSVDARNALSATMDEICQDASTADDVGAALESHMNADGLARLMMSYFGNYLYEQFCRVFFAQLERKHGYHGATSFLGSIKDFIKSSLENITLGMNLSRVDLFGRDGEQIAQTVMQNTLAVFE